MKSKARKGTIDKYLRMLEALKFYLPVESGHKIKKFIKTKNCNIALINTMLYSKIITAKPDGKVYWTSETPNKQMAEFLRSRTNSISSKELSIMDLETYIYYKNKMDDRLKIVNKDGKIESIKSTTFCDVGKNDYPKDVIKNVETNNCGRIYKSKTKILWGLITLKTTHQYI